MKIGFVNDGLLIWRGGDHPLYEVASRLAKKHDVTIIAPEVDYPGCKLKCVKINGARLVKGSHEDYKFFFNMLRFRKAIRGLIKKERFDILNVHHTNLALAFIGLKNIVFTYQGSPPESISERGIRRIGRWFINRFNLFLLNSFDKTIVISEYLAKNLLSYVQKNKIVVIGEGIEKGFGYCSIDKRYIICQGRHEPHKRIDEVIRLSADLNYPTKIIGSGNLTKELKDLAKKLKAPVEFYSNIPSEQKIKLFRESSTFVSASRWEGFGLPFLEAQACGKPVVGYNLGSIPEIVLDGKTGFLVSDYNNLKSAVSRLLVNKRLRRETGLRAYKFSRQFSWGKVAVEYEKLFQKIASS